MISWKCGRSGRHQHDIAVQGGIELRRGHDVLLKAYRLNTYKHPDKEILVSPDKHEAEVWDAGIIGRTLVAARAVLGVAMGQQLSEGEVKFTRRTHTIFKESRLQS